MCLKIFRLLYSRVLELQMRLEGLLVFVAGARVWMDPNIFQFRIYDPHMRVWVLLFILCTGWVPCEFLQKWRDSRQGWLKEMFVHMIRFQIIFLFKFNRFHTKLSIFGKSQNTSPWVILGAGSRRELQYKHICVIPPERTNPMNEPVFILWICLRWITCRSVSM